MVKFIISEDQLGVNW